MNIFKNYFLLVSSLFLFFFLFSVFFVSAQTSPGGDVIEVRPSIVEPDQPVEAGNVYSYSVRVTNRSGRTETFYPVIENMKSISDSGTPFFTDEETDFGLTQWITIDKNSITLDSNETKVLNFTLDVPEEAGPQGYYGALFISRDAPQLRETGSGVAVKVGTILSFRVQGESHEEVFIREFSLDKGIYSSKEKINFALNIENLGNVLARPRGTATIFNRSGDVIEQILVNHPRPGGIFPGASKNFRFSWNPESVYFGKFTVELDLVYGETGVRTISDSASFWVIPFKIIISVLVGVLIFVLAIFVLVRFYIRKKISAVVGGRRVSRVSHSAHSAPISKLTLITIASLLFTLIFAIVVFFLFS